MLSDFVAKKMPPKHEDSKYHKMCFLESLKILIKKIFVFLDATSTSTVHRLVALWL